MHRSASKKESGKLTVALLIGGVVILLVIAALGIWVSEARRPIIKQPIAFNHKKHIDQGLSCDMCHQYYGAYPVAGLPNTEICMGCHAVELSDSPEEQKVREYGEAGKEIPWKKIYTVPTHVYFSHQRHVTLGKLECTNCHGEMAEQTTPVERPAIDLTMEYCIACHKAEKVTIDCNTCHI